MIGVGVLCRLVRLSGIEAGANNRFVTITRAEPWRGCAKKGNYEFEPGIPIPPWGVLVGVCGCHLQPISEPDATSGRDTPTEENEPWTTTTIYTRSIT